MGLSRMFIAEAPRRSPGHGVVLQHVLQQLCVGEVDDPQDGAKALVSDGGAGGGAVHLVQDAEQSLDEAARQLRVLLHQLRPRVLPLHLRLPACARESRVTSAAEFAGIYPVTVQHTEKQKSLGSRRGMAPRDLGGAASYWAWN